MTISQIWRGPSPYPQGKAGGRNLAQAKLENLAESAPLVASTGTDTQPVSAHPIKPMLTLNIILAWISIRAWKMKFKLFSRVDLNASSASRRRYQCLQRSAPRSITQLKTSSRVKEMTNLKQWFKTNLQLQEPAKASRITRSIQFSLWGGLNLKINSSLCFSRIGKSIARSICHHQTWRSRSLRRLLSNSLGTRQHMPKVLLIKETNLFWARTLQAGFRVETTPLNSLIQWNPTQWTSHHSFADLNSNNTCRLPKTQPLDKRI